MTPARHQRSALFQAIEPLSLTRGIDFISKALEEGSGLGTGLEVTGGGNGIPQCPSEPPPANFITARRMIGKSYALEGPESLLFKKRSQLSKRRALGINTLPGFLRDRNLRLVLLMPYTGQRAIGSLEFRGFEFHHGVDSVVHLVDP